MELAMSRVSVNRICAAVPLILSLMACVWVLGNVAGGVRSGNSDEGLGFKVFWLLIAIQIPFILGYLATAEWRRWKGLAGIVLQVAALVLAFAPVAYFKL
jgi:cytochrome bd-type quinol oxidase subunit 2